ncbi:MAG: alpha/beta hydrolase [Rhodospirillaceae bacterium]
MSLPVHYTGTVTSGDVELFYRRFGKTGGTPILIVHGLSYFSYDWIPVASRLAEAGRDVVAMDMRGFGDSTWSPSRAYAIGDFAGDIVVLMDRLGWETANLLGHSMGGRNSTWCAAEYPDRIATLILGDYTPQNAPAGSQRVTRTVAGVPDAFATVDDALEYFGKSRDLPAGDPGRRRMEAYLKKTGAGYIVKRDAWHRERFRAVLEGKGAGGGPDMWARLAEVQCPTLVVRGKRSDMFAAEDVERVRQTNPRIELVEIDAGHDLAGDAPEALVAEISRFLGGSQPGTQDRGETE